MRSPNRSHLFVLGIALAGATALGCMRTTHRADMRALGHRAVYDLGCPVQQLQLDHVDRRTKAVAGCGRRLVYVEDCDRHGSTSLCTWRLDTPTIAQQNWPQSQAAWQPPTVGVVPGRALQTELFGPGDQPPATTAPEDPLGVPAARQTSRGRAFATDLFQPGADHTPSDRAPRKIRTGLAEDGKGAAPGDGVPRRVRTELFSDTPAPAPTAPEIPTPYDRR